ncbi:MAG: CHAP domain-containing protein [Ruminococcus sp.]|nr:CHAP domain-containing protein [Ruminococcus sp.]
MGFRIFKRRIITTLLILGIISSLVCVSVKIERKSEKNFSPRMTPPEYTNYYYYSGNIFYNSGFGMPNCTAYAWGRVYELLGKEPKLSTSNAREWYSYNRENNFYDYGKTPKLGAIACFDNPYGGHVAVVEDIDAGTITFSNSAFQGENFYLSYADINDKNPGQNGWEFQGYIYPDDFTNSCESLNSMRVISVSDGLNLRKYAGINADVIAVMPKKSQIFITSVYRSDGYLWGKTSYNGNVGYCVIDYTASV